MICHKIAFRNFRNIEKEEISFEPGVNLLYGNNAEGKTNALEGIYLLAQGRSHRTVHEKEFIRHGESFAALKMLYSDQKRSQTLEMRFMGKGKKACAKNDVYLRKMSEFIGNFRAVLFCPEHLAIVKSGPAERRGFADAGISQLDSSYVACLQRYNNILAQRNKLLASAAFDRSVFNSTAEIWASQLSEAAQQVAQKRKEYIEKIEEAYPDIEVQTLNGGQDVYRFVVVTE